MAAERAVEPQAYPGFVYFVRHGKTGPIKVGYSKAPAKRVADMQTANAGDLILMGSIPGNTKVEHFILHTLSAYRLRGEWLRPSGEVLRYLRQCIRAGAVCPFVEKPKPALTIPTPKISPVEQALAISRELTALSRQRRQERREQEARERAEWLAARNG